MIVLPPRPLSVSFSLIHVHLRLTMLPETVSFCLLIATSLAASITLNPSIIQLPRQNVTDFSPPNNATALFQGSWPEVPFRKHLAWHTDLEVQYRMPSSSASQSSTLGDIKLIATKIRNEGPHLAMIHDRLEISGSVWFAFHAKGFNSFRGSEVAMVVELIGDLTNLYGAADIFGALVKTDEDIAEFQIGLRL